MKSDLSWFETKQNTILQALRPYLKKIKKLRMAKKISSQELSESSMQAIQRRLDNLEKQAELSDLYSVHSFWIAMDKVYSKFYSPSSLKCIVCDYENKRENFKVFVDQCMFGGGTLERYQCPNCGCIFGPQKYLDLDEKFVVLDYRLLYSRYQEGNTTNEVRTFFSLNPEKNGLYLDWGCGSESNTLQDLRNQSYDVWGYEPSAPVSSGFIVNSRGEISAKFDAIFSNNVIEHFRNPVDQFKDFSTILKSHGKMAHSSPCYEYSYAYTRFHTLFLTGRSPYILAERTGFKVVDIIRDGEYINHVFERIN